MVSGVVEGHPLDRQQGDKVRDGVENQVELFGTQGFAAVTIEALCAAAGLNPWYFYEQFATKEELLGAVYEHHVVAVLRTVQDAIARSPADPTQRLRAGLSAFVTATLADERAARIG